MMSETPAALLPCPACGSALELIICNSQHRAHCTNHETCWMITPRADTEADAITKANALPRAADTSGSGAVEVTALKRFVREVVKTRCWELDGEFGTDGGSIQDLAGRLGIIVPFTVTPEHVENGYVDGDFEAGDTAYEFASWLLADAKEGHDATND